MHNHPPQPTHSDTHTLAKPLMHSQSNSHVNSHTYTHTSSQIHHKHLSPDLLFRDTHSHYYTLSMMHTQTHSLIFIQKNQTHIVSICVPILCSYMKEIVVFSDPLSSSHPLYSFQLCNQLRRMTLQRPECKK